MESVIIKKKGKEMKTIRNKVGGNLKRRSDAEARTLVATGKWAFVPKSVWKKENRKGKGIK
jgi:hypothetical protein